MADSTNNIAAKRQKNSETDSLLTSEEYQEDEDAIDRLLMDAGFDSDEELAHQNNEPVFSADYDEFGDDFDLADISTVDAISDSEFNPAEGLKASQDFPMELMGSVTDLPDELEDINAEIGENVDLQEDSEGLVQDEVPKIIDDETTIIDEFSDFQDFQDRPAIAEPIFEEDDLIVSSDEIAGTKPDLVYDEFGDDFDDSFPVLSPATDFDITADLEEDISNDFEEDFNSLDEPEVVEPEAIAVETSSQERVQTEPDNAVSLIDAAGIAALMQFKMDQEALNKKNKLQIAEFEAKAKKASIPIYVALAFGIISFLSAIGLGIMAFNSKSENAKLSALLVSQTKDKAGVVANKIDAQQKIDPKTHGDHKINDTTEAAHAANEKPKHEAEHQQPAVATIAEASHDEPESLKDHKESHKDEAAAVDKTHTTTPESVKHEAKQEVAVVEHKAEEKPAEPHKEVEVTVVPPKPVLPEKSTATMETAKKIVNEEPEKKQKVTVKTPESQKVKLVNKDKKDKKNTPESKVGKAQEPKKVNAASDWSVNLVAYKQQWYASGKVAEFAKKGIPVEIMPIKINNVTWYRLSVNGFSDKQEAAAYAGRVKKALNLTSVWVGK